ncbi:MAG: F0F1 ATP synthase subunit delta [Planctomycetota bacterium]|nr:F0F1 ATP synthase subunit delta [Planctomycetota bacterium]
MRVDPVTTRWAHALFNVAKRENILAEVQRDLDKLDDPGGLRAVLEGFHPTTRKFVHLCFSRRRREVLDGIAEAFRVRVLSERGVVEGVVESPRALGSSELGKLKENLAQRLGKEVLLTSRINEELVAGVRVYVGSNMIDQSVQGRMEDLRKKLEAAPLPS